MRRSMFAAAAAVLSLGLAAAGPLTAEAAKGTSASETCEIYEQIAGTVFNFYSGVGAWGTTLKVEPDGSFSGAFRDFNLGETGEGYEEGTVYESVFTGSFSGAKKKDATSWTAKVETLEFETEKDGESEYIEDGCRHVMTEPYGLTKGDDIVIYTPGQKTSALSEDFMSWMIFKIPEDAEELELAAVFNATEGYVFYPDPYAQDPDEASGANEGNAWYDALLYAYENQTMPSGSALPKVKSMPAAPEKPYQDVDLRELQGRWAARYTAEGVEMERVLSVNGDRGRIETLEDGKKVDDACGEGTITITDRSESGECPLFALTDETGEDICLINIRLVKPNVFYDGVFMTEWVREGNDDPDQYLYDTVTLENLQGLWYTEEADKDGLIQILLNVDGDRATLFKTTGSEPDPYWNGSGKVSFQLGKLRSDVAYPELLIRLDEGPAEGVTPGIYIGSVNGDSFYDAGVKRWFMKVTPELWTRAEIDLENHYSVTLMEGSEESEDDGTVRWEIRVTNDRGMDETLIAEIDPLSCYDPGPSGIVSEEDVNFDGIKDVLLYHGSFGAQCVPYFECYLSDGKTLRECYYFDDIPEPMAIGEDKTLTGHLRDGAAAYYEFYYEIEDDAVVETDRLHYVYDDAAGDYVLDV